MPNPPADDASPWGPASAREHREPTDEEMFTCWFCGAENDMRLFKRCTFCNHGPL